MERMHSKYLIIFVLCGVLFAGNAFGQSEGDVKIKADPQLEEELEERLNAKDSMGTYGYRIQIYFGTDKREAEKINRKFKNLYPGFKQESYLKYYQPYWRVRVGNFYKRIDAQSMLMELQKEFDNVLLIKDKIELPKIELIEE